MRWYIEQIQRKTTCNTLNIQIQNNNEIKIYLLNCSIAYNAIFPFFNILIFTKKNLFTRMAHLRLIQAWAGAVNLIYFAYALHVSN